MSGAETVGVLRAAGEPTRLRVLALLSRDELAVMELSHILGQSQPRVSRHLKLLTDAGLVERFPDGAWVFYRLTAAGPRREAVDRVLSLLGSEDGDLQRDLLSLEAVRSDRERSAAAYFARNAARWDELRSLHVEESEVERAILSLVGEGRVGRLIDLGTGTGRMLTLLGPNADQALGLDMSQHMLNIARRRVAEAKLGGAELRHGDIFSTGLSSGAADLVVVHRVLHYLSDPKAALIEAGRLLAPGGRLLIVDFAPHDLEQLRDQHQHRRLGFSDEEIRRWLAAAGLKPGPERALPPVAEGLTVKIWSGERRGPALSRPSRSAA